MKLNYFKYSEAKLRCSSQVKCGPLSVCFFFLWIFESSREHLSPLPRPDDSCLLHLWKIGWEHPLSGRKPCSVKFTPLAPFWESPVGLPKKIKKHKKYSLNKEGRGQNVMTWVNYPLLSHCISVCACVCVSSW